MKCHGHIYRYLRSEKTDIAREEGTVIERSEVDVFFCEQCLSYRRLTVKILKTRHGQTGWDTIWARNSAA